MRAESNTAQQARDARKTIGRLFIALALFVTAVLGVDWALRAEEFPVRNLRFEGEFDHISAPLLRDAVFDAVRGNFFLVDLDEVRRRVEALPWVYRASVRRQWPRDIHISYTEQKLVARWGEVSERGTEADSKTAQWVNESGETVALVTDAASPDLPRLEGPKDTAAHVLAQYRSLVRVLEGSGLQLTRLTLTPRRSWRMELNVNGHVLLAVMDRDDPEKKISRFAHVFAEQLAQRAGAIRRVDLRYTNGFSVEWGDEAAAQHAGENTRHRNSVDRAAPAQAAAYEAVPVGSKTTLAGYEG